MAFRWLGEIYEPALRQIPPDLRGKLEPAEIFHQLLEHRWFMSEQVGRCVSMEESIASYVPRILTPAPDERTEGLFRGSESPGEIRLIRLLSWDRHSNREHRPRPYRSARNRPEPLQ